MKCIPEPALHADPTLPLAWQGLAEMHDRKNLDVPRVFEFCIGDPTGAAAPTRDTGLDKFWIFRREIRRSSVIQECIQTNASGKSTRPLPAELDPEWGGAWEDYRCRTGWHRHEWFIEDHPYLQKD